MKKAAEAVLRERKSRYQKTLARNHFGYFIKYMNKHFVFSWHHILLAKKLNDFAHKKIKRLIINLPPGHSKTFMSSEYLPAYIFGINPQARIIAASYGSSLAEKNSRSVQKIIDTIKYQQLFPNTFLPESAFKKSSISKKFKQTDAEFELVGEDLGSYRCAGIDGTATGLRASFLLIDDPYKNLKEATSKARNNLVKENYKSTFYTRLKGDGSILVIQTRWTEDDLCGDLINASDLGEGDQFEVIKLPAISNDLSLLNEYDLRKEIDMPLWPQEYSLERLLKTKAAVGSKNFSALYQQEPAPEQGTVINPTWFKYYKELPQLDYKFASWDFTFKGTDEADFVVGQVWGVSGVRKFLIDQIREQASFTRALQMLVIMNAKHNDLIENVIEDKANGPAIIDTIRQKIPSIIEFNPQGSKVERAKAVSPQIEAGNIFLPDPDYSPDKANWVFDYIEEWKSFPFGAHDDQVDASTQAIIRCTTSANAWLEQLLGQDDQQSAVAEQVAKLFGWDMGGHSHGIKLGF